MPYVSHDLTPRFEDEINSEVIDFQVETVSEEGFANVESTHAHHLIAWVPLEEGGKLRTTSYNQKKKERVQSYVQEDGGVNIGTEEWADKQIILLVLEDTIDG